MGETRDTLLEMGRDVHTKNRSHQWSEHSQLMSD